MCKEGLSTESQLPLDGAKGDTITFTSWLPKLLEDMQECGLDSVFRIEVSGKEIYILKEWGQITDQLVTDWLHYLATHGDKFDKANLHWSGRKLQKSISSDLWSEIEKDLDEDFSGPRVFAAIVHHHQQLSTTAVRDLVNQLQKLTLSKETAEDVNKFSHKLTELCRRIEGTGHAPPDLACLVASTFIHASDEGLRLEI